MKKLIILALLVLCLAPVALAKVDVTYDFNVNNVDVQAFNCLDSSCDTVGTFSGSFPDGMSTNDGDIRVRFPSTLATPYGYAIFYSSSTYLPVEGFATWHSFGDPATYTTSMNVDLEQVAQCKATIDSFSVINDAQANIPLIISVNASLDAETHSAFYLVDNQIGYVPEDLKDEFYSADTQVTLEIRDSNNAVVHTETVDFTIFADDTMEAEFSWTPTLTGDYTAVVKTNVTDDQCADSLEQSSSKEFVVFSQAPLNQCYTLLNDLTLSNAFPNIGDEVTFYFSKITNHANQQGVLESIPTRATYEITDGSGSTVFSETADLAENPDIMNPTTHGFSWTPISEGQHSVTITGTGLSDLCDGWDNTEEVLTVNVYVDTPPRYDINFQIIDSKSGDAVEGATITVDSASINSVTGQTNVDGLLSFTGLDSGSYSYTITQDGYYPLDGIVVVTNSDVSLLLPMTPTTLEVYNATFLITDAATGLPLENARVIASGQSAMSDDAGTALVSGLFPGDYSYVVSLAGYSDATGDFTIDNDSISIAVAMDQLPVGQYSVTFHVTDAANGEDLDGALVAVGGVVGTTFDGELTFNGLIPGTYSYQVSYPEYGTESGLFTVIDGDLTISIQLEESEAVKDGKKIDLGFFIGSIRIPDAYDARPGQWIDVVVQFENSGNARIHDAEATVVSQELGIRANAGPDDISAGQLVTEHLWLEIPVDAAPGEYPLRITISSDKVKRVVYRDIYLS